MSVVARVGSIFSRVTNRVVPDPFVLALGLTAFVLLIGTVRLAGADDAGLSDAFAQMLTAWVGGFGNGGGLAFALQMALVLVSGQALALSPPMTRALGSLAALPKTTAQAGALVALTTCLASLVHWGLGAIAGAIVAREIGRVSLQRGLRFHYPLLGAAGYTGFAVFHGGLSGSAPLKVAEEGHFLADSLGVVPMSQTVFGPLNLAVITGVTLAFVALFYLLAPADDDPEFELPPSDLPTADTATAPTPIARTLSIIFGAVPFGGLVVALIAGWTSFDINAFTMLFLFAGMALHGDLQKYVDAVTDAARAAGPIMLQYPFYFAIIGMMNACGLTEAISDAIIQTATATTFPAFAYVSAAIVNIIIPSGGGQWAVQGPILVQAGTALGVDPSTIVMSFAHGDASTNLLQPFWALPLLGLMRLRAGQIIGYSAIACLLMAVVTLPLLILLG